MNCFLFHKLPESLTTKHVLKTYPGQRQPSEKPGNRITLDHIQTTISDRWEKGCRSLLLFIG